MTRKRFIKLLMSHGISRNEAVKIAADYNSQNVPYETAYVKEIARSLKSCIPFDIGNFKKSIAEADAAFRNLASSLKRATENVVRGIGR